jgi:hypothetical protein
LLGTHTTYKWGQDAEQYVLLKDLTEVNHRTKHANMCALDYFLNDLTTSIHRKLMLECVSDYCSTNEELYYNGDFRGMVNVPLFVSERMEKELVAVRNASLLTYAENKFTGYVNNLKRYHRYLHVRREGQDDFKLLETRYSNSYREKIYRRMNGLAYQYRKAGCVYLVLTLDPKKYGYDKIRMWREHKKDFHNFIQKVRRNFARRGLDLPKYIHTVEGMKEPRSCGNPHINVVFFGCRRLLDWRLVLQYWGKGSIRINRTKDGYKVRNPVMYVCKYITKTYMNTDAENVLTQSLVWLFNCKSFSCSNGLIVPLHPKSTGEWTADYIAVCSPQETIFEDIDLIKKRAVGGGGFVGTIPPPCRMTR